MCDGCHTPLPELKVQNGYGMSDSRVAVEYNPFEPGFTDDPYPRYRLLRENDPVHETQMGFWVLFGYEHVLHFLRDPGLSVEDRNAAPTMLDELVRQVAGDRSERGSRAMLNRDPPDHTRLRKLVSKAFTPRTVESLRPRIQQLVDEALDRAKGAGEMDVIAELAFPLPFQVISEMLGMPGTDRDRLRQWSGLIVRSLEPLIDPDLIRAIAQASDAMHELVAEAVAAKRKNPADDLLSKLIAAEEHGDVLSDAELLEQVILLYIAGHETTVNLIGNGTLALLHNPGQLDRLRDDPSLDENAIHELLRFDSPVQMSRRITVRDVEVDGKVIPEGRFVVLTLASANRDPARWGPSADALDLSREDASQHLSFGGGAHFCLGASLARLEGEVAIGSLVRRFGRIELSDEPTWNGRINLRGLERLEVSVG